MEDDSSKPMVVRGARACTVCRQAKMKCVGAEDGQKQCQRCQRAKVECVFEKHRRGRKPGSKLSEASKMLRRLEKGLNSAKLKSHVAEQPHASASPNEIPEQSGREMDEDEDDPDPENRALFPAKLIGKENQRNSFFRTILNPADPNPSPSRPLNSPTSGAPLDAISAGIVDDELAAILFDLLFLRLNPFINLFDVTLHTPQRVRARCPLLFTTLIAAATKFFRPELYKSCQKLAHDLAVRAFAEAWKRVEVVQAFACLTYWRDPDDNASQNPCDTRFDLSFYSAPGPTSVMLASRMAIELGLNRYCSTPPPNETELQRLERRNRERTYLVLFIHDRSLSTQTGRSWMLPEDELVRHAATWHENGGATLRPEDVIVAAFVQLRRISSETTDMFYTKGGVPNGSHNDVNYEVVLRNCNGKLTQWSDTWQAEMQRAGGESFHFSVLSYFGLHVRLFLNSFGIQESMSPSSRASPSLQALSACCTSAMDSLKIVSKDFPSMSMLRYSQDSVTVMSAYSAVFLLKLLRSSNTLAQLHEGAAHDINSLISKTADAFYDASMLSPTSTSAAYHARFLRSLLTNDIFKARQSEPDRFNGMPLDPRLSAVQTQPVLYNQQQISPTHDQPQSYQYSSVSPTHEQYQGETAPRHAAAYSSHAETNYVPSINHASELDAHYWRSMFVELGFGDSQSDHSRGGHPQGGNHYMHPIHY
ncbi:Zn(2)-C6 fungal-type domain-containing protein [Mycena indigotica]|uniref:Zn(2)-C6 fungal-type domain-containing protein n=1 Tax=Mycena indigotica TaxID=2126181 RepID=A0A8H6VX84_9AGAR|nr:Zn(2)-C6 fungal-type domain-containing protein [Mycena indigotica]KAF7295231.1 Zn(2)-C6 fungal-type domain-containing protein [Mycena indigotica]